MTRHTSPFHYSIGINGKSSIGGGSNPKLQTTHELLSGESNGMLRSSKGIPTQHANNNISSNNGMHVLSGQGGGGVPGGNRPGINSSGANVKKNGSMGLSGGLGSYHNYDHKHIASQANYSHNPQSIMTGVIGISTG